MSEEEGIRASLSEIDAIVSQMKAKKDLNTAIQFAVRGLDIRRAYFGLGSHEFERARLHAARMVLEAASAQQILGHLKECAELLAQVDNFTTFSLPEFPELEFLRLLTRFRMMKELMITRHRQGRGRSALTFGRHLLDLGKQLYLLFELPTVHLNIASVYSMMKMHHESLTHCFFGFQKTCIILEAVTPGGAAASSSPSSSFINTCLAMEACVNAQQDEEAFRLFEECGRLHTDEMGDTADEQAAVPSLAPESMTEATRRWGGVLALAYRSIAVEQEHLEQFASSSLTYKMAHTTALGCLGHDHPVTLQCEQSFKDAEAASKYRDRRNRAPEAKGPLKVVRVRSTARTILADLSKIDSPPPVGTSQSMPGGGKSTAATAGASANQSRGSNGSMKTRVSRPLWNQWFNSSIPASEYAELAKVPHTAPADRSRPIVSQAVGLDISALVDDEDVDAVAGAALDPDVTEIVGRGKSSLNSTQQSSLAHQPIRRANTSQAARRHQDAINEARSASAGPSDPEDDENFCASQTPEINAADYSFLVNTFKLPYDINFRCPQRSLFTPGSRNRNSGKSELRALAVERRLAEAMAAELGLL
jgi:hypothetical protein